MVAVTKAWLVMTASVPVATRASARLPAAASAVPVARPAAAASLVSGPLPHAESASAPRL
ncbi:hypothetical protein WS84_27215 [Burkholderia anthina]|nr:hypothetical protein WS85_30715 [Burkholderia anthina]KVH05240.1 hypothetical protein WS84_27215 [Burkholderia anthina]OXI20680.1 hypothetical protein CFB35_24895 [Burkholderia sp. AU16482]RQV85391.1 hypothetical protein DF160_07320 [Burkholderia anthina]